jgi:hypothetical protein
MSWRYDSNGNIYTYDKVGHVPNNTDIARRWLITEFQMATTKPEVEITCK